MATKKIIFGDNNTYLDNVLRQLQMGSEAMSQYSEASKVQDDPALKFNSIGVSESVEIVRRVFDLYMEVYNDVQAVTTIEFNEIEFTKVGNAFRFVDSLIQDISKENNSLIRDFYAISRNEAELYSVFRNTLPESQSEISLYTKGSQESNYGAQYGYGQSLIAGGSAFVIDQKISSISDGKNELLEQSGGTVTEGDCVGIVSELAKNKDVVESPYSNTSAVYAGLPILQNSALKEKLKSGDFEQTIEESTKGVLTGSLTRSGVGNLI